jgi:RNA polymerase sigma-70 factor (ECF subfamily)
MPADAMPFAPLSETEAQRIARGLRRKDLALVSELVDRYQHRLAKYLLYVTGRREPIEDLIQETWVRVLDRGSQYDGRGVFEGWLFSIARRRALDYLRHRQNDRLDTIESACEEESVPRDLPVSDHPSPFLTAARREDAVRLAAAMERLGPLHREALLLRFHEDLSLQEIAGIVGASVPTVSSRIYRGLDLLRSYWEGGANAV